MIQPLTRYSSLITYSFMSIQKNTLRVLRNSLYRLYKNTGQRFRQVNRSFLRHVTSGPDPVETAPEITDRRTNNDWKRLQPVWVLSTGRTGTNTMTELFRLSPLTDAFHEPSPELFQFSYDYHMDHISRDEALRALMYLRDEIVFRSSRDGLIYIETNNRVTYLADLLLELFPESRFIYLYRNPYDFIRSGMRRRYYRGHMRDSTRIIPKASDPYYREWDSFSDIEKVAWYWASVNSHCIRFTEQLPDRQKMDLASERFFEMAPPLVDQLFSFIGSDEYHPPVSDVERTMGAKHNAQTEGSFSRPKDWTDEQMARVDRIIGPVARELSYRLFTHEETHSSLHLE